MTTSPRLSKRQRRLQQKAGEEGNNGIRINFDLQHIEPLTVNQRATFDSYNEDRNLMLHGIAGTGKSFISLYLSLKTILKDRDDRYKKVVIVRSTVPTRDVGFLPGNNKEKMKVYEAPYVDIFSKLFGRGDAYEYLKNKGVVEFTSTSFIRGITLEDSIVIVDEMQNMDWGELTSIITRVGENCKILFCGDFRQSDFRLREKDSKNDVIKFMEVIQRMGDDFDFIEFNANDIVRSKLVKNFILTLDKMGFSC